MDTDIRFHRGTTAFARDEQRKGVACVEHPGDARVAQGGLRAMFEAALGLCAADRRVFLAQQCADPTLRERVWKMLLADDEDTQALRGFDAVALSRSLDPAPPAWPTGTRFGAFEVIERIGEGGSSSVYLARRDVGGALQHVALKVMHRSLGSAEARAQFAGERKVLARLGHPNVAQCLDGGVTATGIGYLALEWVDGIPITEHAVAAALPLRQCVGLLIDACRGVEAAHERLIVHRDLKPANLLVAASGGVKVIDFGIAALLDASDSDSDFDDSRSLRGAFTPAYAAPEQRDGGRITLATDVHGLGRVLDDLIRGAASRQRASRANVARRERSFGGDMQRVADKACDPDPARRYPSAGVFADELRRALDGEALLVRGRAPGYLFRTWLAQNRVAALIAMVLCLCILAASLLALGHAGRARDLSAAARADAARTEAVRAFMFSVFADAEPGAPSAAPLRIVDAVRRAAWDSGVDAVADPRVAAELQLLLARLVSAHEGGSGAGELSTRARARLSAVLAKDDPRLSEADLLLARKALHAGDLGGARSLVDGVLAGVSIAPEVAAEARLVSAEIHLASRAPVRARADADRALALLAGAVGPSRAGMLHGIADVYLRAHDDAGRVAAYAALVRSETARFGPGHARSARARTLLEDARRAVVARAPAQREPA